MIHDIALGATAGLIAALVTAILCSLKPRKRLLTAQEVCDRWNKKMREGAEAYRRAIERMGR